MDQKLKIYRPTDVTFQTKVFFLKLHVKNNYYGDDIFNAVFLGCNNC